VRDGGSVRGVSEQAAGSRGLEGGSLGTHGGG
jgi:hypothetical protein